jgi:hypothetical protein
MLLMPYTLLLTEELNLMPEIRLNLNIKINRFGNYHFAQTLFPPDTMNSIAEQSEDVVFLPPETSANVFITCPPPQVS